MATTKDKSQQPIKEKTILTKIAGQIGSLAGKLVANKDHLVEIAGEAIESVKSSVHNDTVKKKAAPAKKSVKAKAKKSTTKSPPLPEIKKLAKPAASKKTAPLKKTIKKVAKKATGKK